MYYRNTFPEFLEAITIGPDPSFLEKNTTNCEFVSAFPQEVELMYDWKKVKRSSNPLNALRNFTKKLTLYGPDLDVQTIIFFVKKINVYPEYYTKIVKEELINAFEYANNIYIPEDKINTSLVPIITSTPLPVGTSGGTTPLTGTGFMGLTGVVAVVNGGGGGEMGGGDGNPNGNYFITNHTRIDNDNKFLNKLANLLKSCKKPCNYFKPGSSSIGTLTDFGRALSDSASVLGAAANDILHAPTNISTYVLNKVKPAVRSEFFKLKIMTQDLYRDGVKPFFSKQDRERVKDQLSQGITPDNKFSRLPLTGDTSTYFTASQSHSELQATLQQQIGDCFRMHDYNQRYNPYDPAMNAAYAKRKFMGIKNGNVKSLIDIFGSPAPAQYTTENTYANALDIPRQPDFIKHEDLPKAPKYDTYDGPSAAGAAVVTAGGGATTDPVNASGSAITNSSANNGLENAPTNGKIMEFDFNEVKLTKYGYINDETPDSGTQMGLGFQDNMIIPLQSIAVAPETLPYHEKYNPTGKGLIKRGDVLIITCTDKAGNTFQERRHVADASASGLLKVKDHTYKFLIDEFQPDARLYPSKLAGRSKELKITIQVADTKQPFAKWNVQQASQFAPMFLCKKDWDSALAKGGYKADGLKLSIHNRMKSGEFDQYKKFS